jgi:hypothetical protein
MQAAQSDAEDVEARPSVKVNDRNEQNRGDRKGAAKDEKTPQAILAMNQLKLRGAVYMLQEEIDILEAWKRGDRLRLEWEQAQIYQQGALSSTQRQQLFEEAEGAITQLSSQIRDVTRQIDEIGRLPGGGRANSIVGGEFQQLVDMRDQLETARDQRITFRNWLARPQALAQEGERADDLVRRAQDALKEAAQELDKLAGDTLRKTIDDYKRLNTDQEVKSAIKELNKKARGKLKLGPSEELKRIDESMRHQRKGQAVQPHGGRRGS